MSGESVLTENADSGLTPRTWRQWWRELPGYWRIGAWTAVVLLAVHVALAIRTVIVYQEAAEIVALRQRGVEVRYLWESGYLGPVGRQKPPLERLFWSGIHGRTCLNVRAAIIDNRGNQDELFREVCGLFPDLECIVVRDAELSDQSLAALTQCPHLKWISLSGCNITDDGVDLLTKNQEWVGIYLHGTLITDASLPKFLPLKSLRFLNVIATAVTSPGIEAWQASADTSWFRLFADPGEDQFYLVILWPDGRRDALFPDGYTLRVEGPLVDGESSGSANLTSWNIRNMQQDLARMLPTFGDGQYRLLLSNGKHAAEPVVVRVQGGKLFPGRFEFVMPVTKDKALRSVGK